jgi:AraC-like DNA-binding protein
MDALSDLLRVVKLSGGVFLEAEFTAPWCVKSQVEAEDWRHALMEPKRVIAFHYVVVGRLFLQVAGAPPVEVREGAIVLLPHNDVHTLASGPGLWAERVEPFMRPEPGAGLVQIRHGGGGETTRIVCGFVGSDARHHPLLDALPPTLVLDLNGNPAFDWLSSSFRFAAAELASARPGFVAVLARLSELMFVEALRCHLQSLPMDRRGWLAGLRDPAVGRALALLHTRVAHPWTTEGLAHEVFLSRSAFAERFTTLVGMPPMAYLANWRMQVAAKRLLECQLAVAQVAEEVGYEPEAAFARAFKREFSITPAQWRKKSRH